MQTIGQTFNVSELVNDSLESEFPQFLWRNRASKKGFGKARVEGCPQYSPAVERQSVNVCKR